MNQSEENLDCHFTWTPEKNDDDCKPDAALNHLIQATKYHTEIEFMCLTLIAYLHCVAKSPNYDSALEVIDECVDKCNSVDESKREETLGYEVVAMRNKIFILRKISQEAEALKIAEAISKLKLGKKSEAAIFGTRAYALSMFGRNNYEASLNFYTKARKLDDKNYLWCFGIAFSSGRIRRLIEGTRTLPSETEEENFRIACELSNWEKAVPVVFLADIIFARGREYKALKVPKDEKLVNEAKDLFIKAYKLDPESTNVLTKCGKAFNLMNHDELALKCLKHAVELDPTNSQALHRLGQFYEFTDSFKNLQLAEKYYLQAVTSGKRRNFFAECDLSRARKKLDVTYNLVLHYEEMKPFYKNDKMRLEALDGRIEEAKSYQRSRRQKQFGKNFKQFNPKRY